MPDMWYSDAALAKQEAADRKLAAGQSLTTDDLRGLYEPRVHPAEDEQCRCCGIDAREDVGGNGEYCSICIGRGHHEKEE